MDVVIERCAGIDIGKRTMAVTIRTPGKGRARRKETRTFRTVTGAVLELRDWPVAERMQTAAMEATSDYWKPVFYLLEDAIECRLLNAHHLKAVPGRKTDVKDSEWIAQLVEHGLVRPSFVPPPPIREPSPVPVCHCQRCSNSRWE
ncbi:IS110 family transposase [Lentzea sp. NPDC004789]